MGGGSTSKRGGTSGARSEGRGRGRGAWSGGDHRGGGAKAWDEEKGGRTKEDEDKEKGAKRTGRTGSEDPERGCSEGRRQQRAPITVHDGGVAAGCRAQRGLAKRRGPSRHRANRHVDTTIQPTRRASRNAPHASPVSELRVSRLVCRRKQATTRRALRVAPAHAVRPRRTPQHEVVRCKIALAYAEV